ncbi:MAG: hypothetical protein JST68_00980 [Bacteroidetes bacterium]|nr:hypothetical protein [Bacteroidota bacterium]
MPLRSALFAVQSLFRPVITFLFLLGFSLSASSQQWTTSGNNIYNNNTGNVGVGTITPAYPLDVNGTIRAQSGTLLLMTGNAGLTGTCLATHLFNTCGSSGYLTFGFNTTTGAGTSTPDPLVIQQSNLSVGINTNNPQAKLHIKGAGATSSTSSFLVLNSAGTEMFRVVDNGNIGVGTSSPRTNVEVTGYLSATTGLSIGGTSFTSNAPVNGFTLKNESNFGTFNMGSGMGFGYKFKTNTIDRLVIGDANTKLLNSNMLINTQTDNGNKLQVNGNLWTTGFILTTGAAAGKVLTSDASGNATWQTASGTSGWALTGNSTVDPSTTFVGTTDNSSVAFRTSNSERMRIDGATGNILIGKTSQVNTGYQLDINGNIRAARVVVNTSGADFVFDSAYRITPLSDVEKFILAHHHLPQIAPASEMQTQGADLGDLQTQLLAKVEELTLYVIDQDKRLEQEASRNKEQQAIIDRQAKLLEQQQKLLEQIQEKMTKKP